MPTKRIIHPVMDRKMSKQSKATFAKKKHDLEAALGDDNEEIEDLSEDAKLSYNSLLKTKSTLKTKGILSPSPDATHDASGLLKKAKRNEDDSRLPEYPSTSPLDERALQSAVIKANKAFSEGNGWRVAVEEGAALELARAKEVFASNSNLYAKMELMCDQLFRNTERIFEAASHEPPKLLSNPKNKDLQSRFETLQEVAQKFEDELKGWETVRSTLMPRTSFTTQETETEFNDEVDDDELFSRLATSATVPFDVLKVVEAHTRRLKKVQSEISEAEKETAALVSSYAKTAFEEEARNPRMLIHTLAASSAGAAGPTATTIGEDTNSSDF